MGRFRNIAAQAILSKKSLFRLLLHAVTYRSPQLAAMPHSEPESVVRLTDLGTG